MEFVENSIFLFMKRTTITDLAKACGTSKSTVSRVLTKKGYISPEISELVLNAAKEMNYIPQKSHNKNIKDMVMVISCQLSSDAQVILSNAISDTLAANNIKTVIAPCEFGSEIVNEYIDYAREKNFGGLILLGALETKELRRSLASLSCPIVLLNQELDYLDTSSVIIDEYDCSYNITKYLIENGHKDIAFLSGQKNASAIKDRVNGYIKCMKDNNLKAIPIYKTFSQESGKEFAAYINSNPKQFTSVIIATDEIANGFLLEAQKLRMRIPDDISIITYGDSLICKVYNPSISSISYDFDTIGKQMADLLIKRINKPFSKCQRLISKPKFIIRESIVKKV